MADWVPLDVDVEVFVGVDSEELEGATDTVLVTPITVLVPTAVIPGVVTELKVDTPCIER